MLALAARLVADGVGFALITVVRATRPTSGKPGDKAILTQRGEWHGWVGGSCAEPTARRAAAAAMRDGECRLIHITNEEIDFARPGVEVAAMTCHSGGSLEIYVEPHLPAPYLVVFGRSPIARALSQLGALLRYRCIAADLAQAGGGEASTVGTLAQLEGLSGRGFVVVASHGHSEVEALEWALKSSAAYVGLVTSRRRLTDVLAQLRARGLSESSLARLHAPAGLALGATGPEEVALSVLSQIIAEGNGVELAARPLAERESPLAAAPPAAPEAAPRAIRAPAAAARRSCCDDADEPAPAAPHRNIAAREAAPRASGRDVGGDPPRLTAEPRVSAVVLAAGLSRRMGARNKLLLSMGGEPIIRRVVRGVLEAGFSEVVVVLGHQAEEVHRALDGLGVRQVQNEAFESGQVSSVRAGLAALEQPADAVAICLGDQPLVGRVELLELRAAYATRPHGSILVPFRNEARGNPVILDWQSARQTLERGTNFGCRHFMDENPDRVYRWPAPSDHFVRDIDEPADYETLLAQHSGIA
jgi:CTP:molybdopterin cytidylyltransferase MocA/xanthine/CO dehydrogenase XdhC/CoxF family maturation factor